MGAEGSIVIYDDEKIKGLMKQRYPECNDEDLWSKFKKLGCCNIYKNEIFGKEVYTVYYGENNDYTSFEDGSDDEYFQSVYLDIWEVWT